MNSREYGLSEGPMVKGNGYKPPNLHRWGPGVRDVYALHYIVSGRGYWKTGQAVHPVEAGESFMIFPQMEVYYYPDPQDPWAYCWIEFSGAEALRLLAMIHISPDQPVVIAAPQNFRAMFDQVKRMNWSRTHGSARMRCFICCCRITWSIIRASAPVSRRTI